MTDIGKARRDRGRCGCFKNFCYKSDSAPGTIEQFPPQVGSVSGLQSNGQSDGGCAVGADTGAGATAGTPITATPITGASTAGAAASASAC